MNNNIQVMGVFITCILKEIAVIMIQQRSPLMDGILRGAYIFHFPLFPIFGFLKGSRGGGVLSTELGGGLHNLEKNST